jgi:hypothetical protein
MRQRGVVYTAFTAQLDAYVSSRWQQFLLGVYFECFALGW